MVVVWNARVVVPVHGEYSVRHYFVEASCCATIFPIKQRDIAHLKNMWHVSIYYSHMVQITKIKSSVHLPFVRHNSVRVCETNEINLRNLRVSSLSFIWITHLATTGARIFAVTFLTLGPGTFLAWISVKTDWNWFKHISDWVGIICKNSCEYSKPKSCFLMGVVGMALVYHVLCACGDQRVFMWSVHRHVDCNLCWNQGNCLMCRIKPRIIK